jgi:hypothetical protein
MASAKRNPHATIHNLEDSMAAGRIRNRALDKVIARAKELQDGLLLYYLVTVQQQDAFIDRKLRDARGCVYHEEG